MFVPILFYDSASQTPLPPFTRCPALQMVGRPDCFSAELQRCDLAILQVGGPLRQACLHELLAVRKSFALLGLDQETLRHRHSLAQRARKRRCRACWLASLRGFTAAARLQEIISSGCLGTVTAWEWQGGPWEPYQIQDLVAWLTGTNELTIPSFASSPAGTLQLQATLGQAEMTLDESGPSSMQVRMQNFPLKQYSFHNDPLATELATLLLLARQMQSWCILPEL
ncbi:MAG: hypothetical protein GX564_13130 [Oligosphaeraceae bacterium]|nr:hypothetical protein [Oligosphaeraceae bacterium]